MTDSSYKPTIIPVKCAVCNGFGTVNWGKASCHACGGKGYIMVPAKEEKKGESDGKFEKS